MSRKKPNADLQQARPGPARNHVRAWCTWSTMFHGPWWGAWIEHPFLGHFSRSTWILVDRSTIWWSLSLPVMIERLISNFDWFRPDLDCFLGIFGPFNADSTVELISSIIQRIGLRFWWGLDLNSSGDEPYLRRGLGRSFVSLSVVKKLK